MKNFIFLKAIILCCLFAQSCLPVRIMRFNRPEIDDAVLFKCDTVKAATKPFRFVEPKGYKPLPDMAYWAKKESPFDGNLSVEEFLTKTKTSSFLVIRNDSILYENYFNGYHADDPVIIFSVTKAIVTTLVGIALKEGHLKSTQQKVVEFIPAFAVDERRDITIEHLLQMTSGLNMLDYKDFFKIGALYYSNDLEHFIKKIKIKHKPGTHFAYKSLDTQILGLCLEKATGKRLSDYLEEKLWKPMGMECDAYITLDRQDMPRYYGGMAACARDLAKFGKLFMNNGSWEGKQLVPTEWVTRGTTIAPRPDSWWGYSTGWWLHTLDRNMQEKQDFAAAGFSGQRIYVNPESNMIIVRQGNRDEKINWTSLCSRLSNLLNNCTPRGCNIADILPQQMEGRYQAKGDFMMRLVQRNERKWILHWGFLGLIRTRFEVESPRCLFSKRRQHRLIFESDSTQQEVVGLHYDFLDKMRYYEKVVAPDSSGD